MTRRCPVIAHTLLIWNLGSRPGNWSGYAGGQEWWGLALTYILHRRSRHERVAWQAPSMAKNGENRSAPRPQSRRNSVVDGWLPQDARPVRSATSVR
jgi:hypothetical protein